MRSVDQLNEATADEAFTALLRCCGSVKWAYNMVARRPFQDMDELLAAADHEWWSLGGEDWLEAFASHPKIGEKKVTEVSKSDSWASEEQSGASHAAIETLDALRQANQDYERRFGYIFIVCATGKNADEMLALLNARVNNDPDTELRIAAEEQRRITNLRLNKLLSNVE